MHSWLIHILYASYSVGLCVREIRLDKKSLDKKSCRPLQNVDFNKDSIDFGNDTKSFKKVPYKGRWAHFNVKLYFWTGLLCVS